MKERPFVARQSEVRGILDGTLTELMQPIKPQPELGKPWRWWVVDPLEMDIPIALCPYGVPGDRLWVRETWGVKTDWLNADDVATSYLVCYKADGRTQWKEVPISQRDKTQEQLLDDVDLLRTRWRPSIHMPRWASRITLEVTGVRVEHVQEISAERVIGRSANPWVWVVEFAISEDRRQLTP